ncbi:uncharacterized protein LOC133723118 isoform X4 [Rosa rugosa]|uniref:uncharacterized protein LOC133723118 isoform X4 n=1 Tax=Rosa rugosa TaxID=74645 RepID=UPI002B40DCE5|nr:uncharacterized protein LOC133723118 isoform X4 [Rosa rugosa]
MQIVICSCMLMTCTSLSRILPLEEFRFNSATRPSNFGPLADQVKDGSRNFHQQSQQQIHGMQSQLQPQHQNPIRLPQQISRQMHPQMQQIAQSKNVPLQQQQQIERMRRCQPSTPRAGMDMVQDRPMVQVKIEAPSELPMDGNAFNSFNNRHPQLQFRQQQIPA